MTAPFTCHFCRVEIGATELHVVCTDYPIEGCESRFCASCVDIDDPPEVRGERIKQLLIALVTADDLDGPRILPGSA